MAQNNDEGVSLTGKGDSLVGRTVCKEFAFGRLEGKVAFCHRPDGDALLFRVEYADGDSEDLPEDEARELVLPSSASIPLQPPSSKPPAVAAVTPASAATFGAGAGGGNGNGAVMVAPANTAGWGSSGTIAVPPEVARVSTTGPSQGDSAAAPRKRKRKRKDKKKTHQVAAVNGAGVHERGGHPGGSDGALATPTISSSGLSGRVEGDRAVMRKDVWKTFNNAVYHGIVAYAHVLTGSAKILYRVVYDDGDEEDMEHHEVLHFMSAHQNQSQGQSQREHQGNGGGDGRDGGRDGMAMPAPQTPRTPTSLPPPLLPQPGAAGAAGATAPVALSKNSTSVNRKKRPVSGAGGRQKEGVKGQRLEEAASPGSAASKFNDFMDTLIMAYEARGMERRKSRQFDGTDEPEAVAPASPPSLSTTPGRSSDAGGARGLLRREVSRAYAAVVTAGEAVSDSSVDALAVLLRLMEEKVQQGLAVDVIPLAATCSDGQGMGRWGQEGPEALASVESSLEACLVCLMIVTCPGLDRRLCSDELIDHCIALFRHHLARHIAPVLDPPLAISIAKGGDGSTSGGGSGESNGRGSGAKNKKAKGGGRGGGGGGGGGHQTPAPGGEGAGLEGAPHHSVDNDDSRLERRLREFSKKLVSGGALGKAYETLGLLDSLVSRVRLEDNVLLQLCNACKSCLVLEATSPSDRRGEGTSRLQPLQHGALGVLQTVSRKYATFRPLLVEDIFGLLLKVPTGRRQLRTFRIAHVPSGIGGANGGTDGYIQNMTALVMLMVQSCVESPPLEMAGTAAAAGGSAVLGVEGGGGVGGMDRRRAQQKQDQQQSGLYPARHVASYFVSRFLSRCCGKEEGANFQPLLTNVVDDLLATVLLPEWPASELLLHALCGALVKDLKDQKGGAGAGGRDQQYYLMAMDVLGRVASGLADINRRERECPMVLPEAMEARTDGSPGDTEEVVRCVCGGAGRGTGEGEEGGVMMLDCDRCHRWFHGHCVGIASQEECPNEWFCVDCTILRQVAAQRNAYAKRQSMGSTSHNLSRELGVEGGGVVEAEPGGGGDGAGGFEVSDLDVFRQLVLNQLTTDGGASRSTQKSAGSTGGFGFSSPSPTAGRALPSSSSSSSSYSSAARRLSVGGRSSVRGGEAGTGGCGERGWGWQARQTRLALWIEETRRERRGGIGGGPEAHLLGQWKADGGSGRSWDALKLAHDGTLRLCRRLLVERDLCRRGLDAIMGHLLVLLRDPSTSLRARAVKRLAGIIDADGSLMRREAVRVSVTSSFLDEAVSVRQAAVDLVGKYILADKVGGSGGRGSGGGRGGQGGEEGAEDGATLLDTYYGALMDRLLDKGVSVRKSVVRTLRGVLLWRSSHPRHTAICRALVERAVVVREEDTIRDLIRDTFQEIWFSEEDDHALQTSANLRGSASATPAVSSRMMSPPSKVSLSASTTGEVAAAAAQSAATSMAVRAVAVQLMEVVHGVKDNEWLVKLLRGMITGPGDGDKHKKDRTKKREASLRRCKALVQALVDVQLGLDEGVSAVPPGTESPLEDLPQQLLACVATLGVLCRASPSFLVPHVYSLLPYLKGENGLSAAEESEICRQVSDIVYEALPLLTSPILAQMTELADDLVHLAYRFGSAVVHSSLRCLARLVRLVTHDAEPLLGLLQSFYSSLYRHRNDVQQIKAPEELTTKVRHNLLRGLVVSGCICRFYSFEEDSLQELDDGGGGGARTTITLAEQVTEEGARLQVFEMLRHYLTRANGPDFRSKALQGLGQLLIGAPRLMLLADKHGVVGAVLAKSAGGEVVVQALRCYKDILEAEEERVETGLARHDMEATGVTVAQRVQGDQDGESSVVGGVLQMHLGAVLSRLFHRNRVVRAAAISLLGVMLRQGLVNPVDVVPQLLALGGDSAAFVRGEAFRLLTVEDSKNGEFVRTRVLDGLFMAYTFQQQVLCDWRPLLPSTDPAAGGTGGGCSIVGPAYTLCVRPQRPSRYSCLRQLLSLFSEGKAWELDAFLCSSREKLGSPGEDGGARSADWTMRHAAKRHRNSLGSEKGDSKGRSWTDPLDMRALSFVCCTLAGLPYQVQEEPLFVVDYVNRQMSLQGSQCLELLHTLLARKGVTTPSPDGDDMDDMEALEAGRNHNAATVQISPSDGFDANGDPRMHSSLPEKLPPVASATVTGQGVGDLTAEKADEEEGMAHLRRTSSAAAAFSMLLRLKAYLKSAYGLSVARCQSYKPSEGTKATEKPAQNPNPPPETFHPLQTRKGSGRALVDPASLAAAAASAAKTLATGPPEELASFYLELRGLAQDDPEDYAGWEGLEETLDGGEGGAESGTDTGSGSDIGNPRRSGKKRRASAGDAVSSAKAKRGGGRWKAAKGKGKKAKSAKRRRRSTGSSAVLSNSSDGGEGEEHDADDGDWS